MLKVHLYTVGLEKPQEDISDKSALENVSIIQKKILAVIQLDKDKRHTKRNVYHNSQPQFLTKTILDCLGFNH